MESVSRATRKRWELTAAFTTQERSITAAPQWASSSVPDCASLWMASRMIQAAAAKISSASMAPEMFSALPCPNG